MVFFLGIFIGKLGLMCFHSATPSPYRDINNVEMKYRSSRLPSSMTGVLIVLLLFCAEVRAVEGNASGKVTSSEEIVQLPSGLQLDVFADETLVANPVAFSIDEMGRVFVCETFRQGKGVEDNRKHRMWLEDDLAAQSAVSYTHLRAHET